MRAARGHGRLHVLRAGSGLVRARRLGIAAAPRARRSDLRGGETVPHAAHARDAVAGTAADDDRVVLPAALVPVHAVRLDSLRAARCRRQRDHHATHRRPVALGLRRLGERALRIVRRPAAGGAPRRGIPPDPADLLRRRRRREVPAGVVRRPRVRQVRRALGDQLRAPHRRCAQLDARRDRSARAVEAARALRARPARARRPDAADRQRRAQTSSTASFATASRPANGRRSTPSG